MNRIDLALYQPDIPQNLGSVLRLCACMGARLHVIGPAGFPLDDRRIKRAGMDYIELADYQSHDSWDAFLNARRQTGGRLVLLTTRADTAYTKFAFAPNDCLLLGRESAGVPQDVHEAADARLTIPMQQGARSLNVALSAAMVLGEALRQIG